MKPIQNQYQDLLEGKMSKHNFLNNVKSTLSEYVSKGNSYEDAISILKSRRIITENIDSIIKKDDTVQNKLTEGTVTLNKFINEIDNVNPIEYRNGISYEVDLAGDFSGEGLQNAVKKVLKNLKKDPIYYTNLKAEATKKINNKKVVSSEYTELKKDNQVDKLNQLKSIVKKEIANTKTSLSKQEKASKAMPKGVKLMKEEKDNYKYKVGKSFIIKNLQKNPDPIYKDVKVGDKITITKAWSNLAGPVYGTNISEKTGLNEKDIEELRAITVNENQESLSANIVQKIVKDNAGPRSDLFYVTDEKDGSVHIKSKLQGAYRLTGSAMRALQEMFDVEEQHERLEDRDVYEYVIRPKTSKPESENKPIRKSLPNDNVPTEDVFENDDKARQKKDLSNFSKKMIGKPSTKQNTIKSKIKEYVVKQLKKEATVYTIGTNREYVSDAEAPGFETKLRTAGVRKFTKSKTQ